MNIWIVRHGETDLNKQKLMQGLTNEPLNKVGIAQAEEMKKKLEGIKFDAVYASPLDRAVTTASIISGVDKSEVIKDKRIVEVCFGLYEKRKYTRLGPVMSLHWLLPDVFPAPKSVESADAVRCRVKVFFDDLKKKDYKNVLICSHGDIMRFINRELSGKGGLVSWKDFPDNCEIKEYKI